MQQLPQSGVAGRDGKTVDHISNGRLILGIGAGWFERDYTEFGYAFGTAPDRLRALREALPVIKQRWSQDVPRPVRDPLPICIGGGGEKVTLKLTAMHATIWNGFGPPESYQHKNAVLNNWCAEVGRDPAEIERSVAMQSNEVAQADAFLAAGATHFIVGLGERGTSMHWPNCLRGAISSRRARATRR